MGAGLGRVALPVVGVPHRPTGDMINANPQALKRSQASFSAWRSASTTKYCWRRTARYVRFAPCVLPIAFAPSDAARLQIFILTMQNRMQESLVLFESVINSRWFLRTSVILFLNKIDVFKQKLPKVPLVHYFPEYTGGADINKAAKYILWRFTQTNRARLSVYPHLTQATDTSNVSLIRAGCVEVSGAKVSRRMR